MTCRRRLRPDATGAGLGAPGGIEVDASALCKPGYMMRKMPTGLAEFTHLSVPAAPPFFHHFFISGTDTAYRLLQF